MNFCFEGSSMSFKMIKIYFDRMVGSKKSTCWLISVKVSQRWSNLAKNGKFEILNSWIIRLINPRPNRNKKHFSMYLLFYLFIFFMFKSTGFEHVDMLIEDGKNTVSTSSIET